MSLFVGLDVSQRLTHLCVVDADGKRVWRGKCATDPTILAQTIRAQAGRRRSTRMTVMMPLPSRSLSARVGTEPCM